MCGKLIRVGTTYIPVHDVEKSVNWYIHYLGAQLNYQDQHKAIIDLANQSFFLVKASSNESCNFIDTHGDKRFSQTFEVDGIKELESLHQYLRSAGVTVGKVEDRGHPGKNFIFADLDGNIFDVWSELSPWFNRKNK